MEAIARRTDNTCTKRNNVTYAAGLFQQQAAKKPRTYKKNGKKYLSETPVLEEDKVIHSASAITDAEDINRIVRNLLRAEKWRDAMLIVLGCNTGWRISDLLRYRVKDILMEDGEVRRSFRPKEKKTKNFREVGYNEAIREMLFLYMEKDPTLTEESYLFYNQSNHKVLVSETEQRALITRQAANDIIKRAVGTIGLQGKFSTHSLRQTFSYHWAKLVTKSEERMQSFMAMQALQIGLGHKAISSTKHYAGYIAEQILGTYDFMNLGLEAIKQYREEN